MLPGAGLGDDALLAHALGEQDLADAIVDLVRAGVIEVLALEIDFRPAQMRAQAFGEIERIGPAHVLPQVIVELGAEDVVVLGLLVGALEFEDERHQRLGDVAAAENAKMSVFVRTRPEAVDRLHRISRGK